MKSPKPASVSAALVVVFGGIATACWLNLWGRTVMPPANPAVASVFTSTNTVRFSASELIASGADVSGMDCQACHEGKPVEVKLDATGRVIIPPAHQDLVFSRMNCAACHAAEQKVELQFDAEGHTIIPKAHQNLTVRHGQNNRNDHCFNCHDATKLNQLHTPGGTKLTLEQSTLLCGSCHGPTYRDWEAGIHGRTGGFWNRASGSTTRKDCTSCHDPHAPAFPSLLPAPGPHRLHPANGYGSAVTTEHAHE